MADYLQKIGEAEERARALEEQLANPELAQKPSDYQRLGKQLALERPLLGAGAPLRVKYLQWRKDRQRRYDEKRAALLEGKKGVVFPEGTYALHFLTGQQREGWKG